MDFVIQRRFSRSQVRPEDLVSWRRVRLASVNAEIEVPDGWSDTAAEIVATRYLRLAQGETSVRQLFARVVDWIAGSARAQGHCQMESAEVLRDELMHILLHQMASFNSPVYFNAGVFARFGLAGTAENYVWDAQLGRARAVTSAYIHPQVSACFIQDVQDDLLSILDLLRSEAKLFKYGSGTGTNFSRLRAKGAPMEGGGESSGLISFLEIFDKAAQAIKSGGTNRRAAKMVLLDADHPQILDFIHWKRNEERKARVLLAAGYSGGMDGEAFRTVSGQNSNNSVRVSDEFMHKALRGEAREAEILREMARAAWECADPGIQFHDTIQRTHLCASEGPIRASNPCSEYMFLDDSACNLASLNLVKFWHGGQFLWPDYAHVARLMLFAQEILIDYASYPTAKIAENSHRFRPLGLGYSNLGGLLMRMGIAYESEAAVQWTTHLTGVLHVEALAASAEMAEVFGAFAGWSQNEKPALGVLERHRLAWQELGALHQELAWVGARFEQVIERAKRFGLRHAQVTLIAPTGTIGLMMDCDTLGIEPDFALIKLKSLSEGGELRLVNGAIEPALLELGYQPVAIRQILHHVETTGWMIGAPALKAEHLAVFDCAMAPPAHPGRRVSTQGHLHIMASAQSFLSGAISKTVNLPSSVTPEDIQKVFVAAWKMGLKSVAIYRDGSKALQPLCAEC